MENLHARGPLLRANDSKIKQNRVLTHVRPFITYLLYGAKHSPPGWAYGGPFGHFWRVGEWRRKWSFLAPLVMIFGVKTDMDSRKPETEIRIIYKLNYRSSLIDVDKGFPCPRAVSRVLLDFALFHKVSRQLLLWWGPEIHDRVCSWGYLHFPLVL